MGGRLWKQLHARGLPLMPQTDGGQRLCSKTEDKILGYPPYFAIVHDEKAELNFWAHRIDGVKALVARLCICAKPEWSRGQWGLPCLWLCSDSAI